MSRGAPTSAADDARTLLLAKLFDLRTFIGSLFVIFGVLVTIAGVFASDAQIEKAAGLQLGLYVGLIMLATGLFFIGWMLVAPPQIVTGTEVTEEDMPEQYRRGGH